MIVGGWVRFVEAMAEGTPERARAVLAAGLDPNARVPSGATLAILAASHPDPSFLSAAMEAGADIHARWTDSGTTALMWACEHGRESCVAMLLEAGAEVEAVDAGGSRALGLAIRRMQPECLELLLAAGASMEGPCMHGYTADQLAIGACKEILARERGLRAALAEGEKIAAASGAVDPAAGSAKGKARSL